MFLIVVRALVLPLKILLGFDAFISYSRRDGTPYVEALEKEIARSVSPRIDLQETRASSNIPLSLGIAVALSKVLVIISTPHASDSAYVASEIETFLKWSNGPVIPVELTFPVNEAGWRSRIPGVPITKEDQAAIASNIPSDRIVLRILDNIGFWRRTRRQSFLSVLALLIFGALAILDYRAGKSLEQTQRLAASARMELQAAREETERQRVVANEARLAEEKARGEAKRQGSIAVWESAARQASSDAFDHTDDDRATLLALQSMRLHDLTPDEPKYLVERALQAVSNLTTFVHVLPTSGFAAKSFESLANQSELVGVSAEGAVAIWDLKESWRPPRTVLNPDAYSRSADSAAISPDGSRVAFGHMFGQVWLRDLHRSSASPTVLGRHLGDVRSVAFSADGTQVAASGRNIHIWNVEHIDRAPVSLAGDGDGVIAFSPNGARLGAGRGDGTISIWNLGLPDAPPIILPGRNNLVCKVAFSSDGTRFAAAMQDGTVQVWNLDQPKAAPFTRFEHRIGCTTVAFAPDGRRIASAGEDGAIHLWEVTVREAPSQLLTGHVGAVHSIAFTSDGARLISAGADKTVRIWQLSGEKSPGAAFVQRESVYAVAFDPDNIHVASASSEGRVQLFNLSQSGLPSVLLMNGGRSLRSVAFDARGSRLATSGDDMIIRIWNLKHPNRSPILLSSNRGAISWLALTHNGTRIISRDRNGILIWRVGHPSAPPEVFLKDNQSITSVAISADGSEIAAAKKDGTIRLWSLGKPTGPSVGFVSHQGTVTCVAFTPDKSLLASGGSDGTLRIWNIYQPNVVPVPLYGNQGPVESVSFSPDGTLVASAGDDGAIRLWDLRRADAPPVVVARSIEPILSLAFSPDGLRIVFAGLDGTVYVRPLWSATTKYLCTRVVRNLSYDEWQLYFGKSLPYASTCPQLPPGLGAPTARW